MKFEETVAVAQPRERVFAFFEDVARVGRCVPGVEEVAAVDESTSKVRVTQKVGAVSATFDLKLELGPREPGRFMEFSAIGRTIKGASGTLRARSRVEFADADGVGTQIQLVADIALGGMLGSVGQGAVSVIAREVTAAFAQSLAAALEQWPSAGGSPA